MRPLASTDFFIPSPTISAFQLGPLTIRFYALAILAGIVIGTWLTARRLRHRGGTTAQTLDIVMWAVPLGIVGGRLYHVITDNQLYFGPGKDPWGALRIWKADWASGAPSHWAWSAPRSAPAWPGCPSPRSWTRQRPGC